MEAKIISGSRSKNGSGSRMGRRMYGGSEAKVKFKSEAETELNADVEEE